MNTATLKNKSRKTTPKAFIQYPITHLRHRCGKNNKDFLALEEDNANEFVIRYYSYEPDYTEDWEEIAAENGTPKMCYFANQSQAFDADYNEALRIFRLRRDSDNPFAVYDERNESSN